MTLPSGTAETDDMGPARQWAALAVLLLAVLIISIDNTVLGFAVPELSESLEPTSMQLLWIVDSYAFVLAGLLVTMGNIGDRIGRRRLLLLGATGFGVASTLAAFSTSPEMLIAARALLGVAGATLMPSTLSLIRNIFPEANTRRIAVGVWTSAFAVGAALGPIVGGWLLEHFWWGSVFLLAVPVAAVLVIAGRLLLPESRNDDPGPFDWISSPISLAAIVPIIYAIKMTADHGPSIDAIFAAALGLTMAVVFVRRQRLVPEPMLDMTLFNNRAFSVAIATNLATNFAMIGGVYFIAQYLQLVAGLGPLDAGLRLLPGMSISLVASLSVAVLLRRGISPALLMAGSMATVAVGFLLVLTMDAAGGSGETVLVMCFIGAGIGAAGSLGVNVVLATVPQRRAGSASAVSETAFELGAALGIALLGSIISAVYRRTIDLPDGLSAGDADRAGDTLALATGVAQDLPPELGQTVTTAAQSAFVDGVHAAGVFAAVLLGICAVVAARTLRGISADAIDANH